MNPEEGKVVLSKRVCVIVCARLYMRVCTCAFVRVCACAFVAYTFDRARLCLCVFVCAFVSVRLCDFKTQSKQCFSYSLAVLFPVKLQSHPIKVSGA